MIYQPVISDGDNNMVVGLVSGSVTLLDASASEFIGVSDEVISRLSDLGISVTGKSSSS